MDAIIRLIRGCWRRGKIVRRDDEAQHLVENDREPDGVEDPRLSLLLNTSAGTACGCPGCTFRT